MYIMSNMNENVYNYVLKLYVNSDNKELYEKYRTLVNKHNESIISNPHPDSGFDLYTPSKIITNGRVISKKLTSFDFYGPTCDSMDYMKGPFILPNNIKENDYIELGQLGAYGLTFRTQFNGFYSEQIFEVEDDPIMTMYNKEAMKEFLVA